MHPLTLMKNQDRKLVRLFTTLAAALLITSSGLAGEYSRADELSYHGFVLIEVVAVAKDCWRTYGKPAGKNLAKNLKGVMEICKRELEHTGLAYHPKAKTLPGEELNCFYLDVLESLAYDDGSYTPWLSKEVYHKEIDRIHAEFFGLPKK